MKAKLINGWVAFVDYLDQGSTKIHVLMFAIVTLCLACLSLMFYWDTEPSLFNVEQVAIKNAKGSVVVGYVTTHALVTVTDTLLSKRGGLLYNDVLPPSVFMDNMPAWEFGVISQARDLALALRNDYSRSQSQSLEDTDLVEAQSLLNISISQWIMPQSERKYQQGIDHLQSYLNRLIDEDEFNAQFYARADNLSDWLAMVEKRLGSLSQRLAASVVQHRINTDLEGDPVATQSTKTPQSIQVKTAWLEIDDVFYEARGSCWALVQFLRAAEIDFRQVLEKKNALISLQQIIRELEQTQASMWSPIVLNGSGFGIVANHSLAMASYISRANAALIELRLLLRQG